MLGHARPEALVTMLVPLLQSLTVGQTERWQAGSTYRIQPIQESAKRPLWNINNRASGFVSCLWEHKENKRACDKVWEWRWRASSTVSDLPVKSFIPSV